MKTDSLVTRTVSGIVFVLVMVGMTLAWYDPETESAGWPFYLLWVVLGLLTVGEYCRLLHSRLRGESACTETVWRLAGILYIGQAFVLIQLADPMAVVTLMTVVWMADTGAYLVGSAVGRHPMAPVISPKKTWEGFGGGLLFAVGTALVWYSLYWRGQLAGGMELWSAAAYDGPQIGALKWAGFGLAVGLAATGGDLIESKFKRWIGVKDSGKLIPGHGGLLDRLDALLLAVPVAWGYAWLTGLLGD